MWQIISQLLPMILGSMNSSGGTGTGTTGMAAGGTGMTSPGGLGSISGILGGIGDRQQSNNLEPKQSTLGGQQVPIQTFPIMPSRQMPSYGNMINQMLQKQRGF